MVQELTTVSVHGSVADAVSALEAALERRGIQVFAAIDHAAGARSAGLELPDEVVILFGNPAVGTRLMQDRPDAGYDLPLRVLIRDDNGSTVLSYRDPVELVHAYGLTTSEPTAAKLSELLAQLGRDVAHRS